LSRQVPNDSIRRSVCQKEAKQPFQDCMEHSIAPETFYTRSENPLAI